MRKKLGLVLILLVVLGILSGCKKQTPENAINIYYLNMEMTTILSEVYVPEETQPDLLAMELLMKMKEQPDSGKLRETIPQTIFVKECTVNNYNAVVDFSSDYYNMSVSEEVLVRAAIVKTLVQIKDIYNVSFTVEGQPLLNDDGMNVGRMSADSFVLNPGAQINTSTETTLTLYFANEQGTGLVKETRKVHYSSNISLDKLVMEQLIEGPSASGDLATVPSMTRLISVSTVDGVCYVNVDDGFTNQNTAVTEQAVLYSIVNSLTELSNVDKVQISINGSTNGKVRYDYDLSTIYEYNERILNYVETEPTVEEE